MKSTGLIFRLLVVSLYLCCVPAGNAVGQSVRTVQIGFAAPLTEMPGKSARDAALLAIDEINARPLLIAGEKIVLKLLDQDDKADANIAVLTARYFIASKVIAVIGHWNSASSIATAKIYSDAGIIQISPSSTSTEYTQQGLPTTFRMVGHDGIRTNYIGEHVLRSLRAERIMVIDDATLFGKTMADQFINYIQANGGLIAGRMSISNKTSNYVLALESVRQARPDLIFHAGRLYSGDLNHSESLLGGLRRLGFPKNVVLAEVTVDPESMREAALGDINIFAISPGIPLEKLPRGKSFQKNFTARFSSRITPYTPSAYDAVYVLAEAMKQAGSLDPLRISAILHNIKYAGLTGPISFDAKGDLTSPSYTLYQIKQGAWVPISVLGR